MIDRCVSFLETYVYKDPWTVTVFFIMIYVVLDLLTRSFLYLAYECWHDVFCTVAPLVLSDVDKYFNPDELRRHSYPFMILILFIYIVRKCKILDPPEKGD